MDRKQLIEYAVDRFLFWKLPEDFAPDCGISFDRIAHNCIPTGTNLLTAEQARHMFSHCLAYPGPVWRQDIDDMDNSTWEAASPYQDDETPLYWRLKPRISCNCIEWYECHDLELMDENSPQGWPTLEEAKAAIAAKHAAIAEVEGLSP